MARPKPLATKDGTPLRPIARQQDPDEVKRLWSIFKRHQKAGHTKAAAKTLCRLSTLPPVVRTRRGKMVPIRTPDAMRWPLPWDPVPLQSQPLPKQHNQLAYIAVADALRDLACIRAYQPDLFFRNFPDGLPALNQANAAKYWDLVLRPLVEDRLPQLTGLQKVSGRWKRVAECEQFLHYLSVAGMDKRLALSRFFADCRRMLADHIAHFSPFTSGLK
jgi:hypothetical protein